MANNINSVSRIHDTILSLNKASINTMVIDVWAQAFDLTSLKGVKRASSVAYKLSLLIEEVELAKRKLEVSYNEKTCNLVVENLDNAFSPMLLSANWGSVKQYLSPEVMVALQIFREALPNEEESINPEELNELHARLTELEIFLEKSALPERVINLITRHINLIREALSNLSITGAKGLIEARRSAYGEFFEVSEVFESKDSHEITELKKVWEIVNKMSDGALKIYGLYEISKETIPLLESLI